jgi:hypothetical protein
MPSTSRRVGLNMIEIDCAVSKPSRYAAILMYSTVRLYAVCMTTDFKICDYVRVITIQIRFITDLLLRNSIYCINFW